jgi:uncharacterized protein YdiU (UPF0061 family)
MTATLRFDDLFVRSLPADPSVERGSRQVKGAAYSFVSPTPVAAPTLVAWSRELAEELGLSELMVESEAFVEAMAGNRLLDGMRPFAACYGGHQFGHWAGQLGDGRAISLGELVTPSGERRELQLKGAGPTPYSRAADGRAVLRSSIREFLCSEAMHWLGVPTTRALTLVRTGDSVVRDMFYDGNARPEPGAIVCRVAPSFLRFGNFQIAAARDDISLLRALLDYSITHHFPQLGPPSEEAYVMWLHEVARRSAELVVHWMRVGFVHGVLNTDNMSVLGLTIDYGPYGWVDNFDTGWTPNTTDAGGKRYAFGNQPRVVLWNLARLAESLLEVVKDRSQLEAALEVYSSTFEAAQRKTMCAKLGIDGLHGSDDELISDCIEVLGLVETDMTMFFRNLAELHSSASVDDAEGVTPPAAMQAAYYSASAIPESKREVIGDWFARYRARIAIDSRPPLERIAEMNGVNPRYVLRNYLAQQAIDGAESGDFSQVRELLRAVRNPYTQSAEFEHLFAKRPEWARHRAGSSMLSCSS